MKYVAIYTGDWHHWRLGTKCALSGRVVGSKKHLQNPTGCETNDADDAKLPPMTDAKSKPLLTPDHLYKLKMSYLFHSFLSLK